MKDKVMSQKIHYLEKKKYAQYKAYLVILFIAKKKLAKFMFPLNHIDLVANKNYLSLTTRRERYFKNKLENLARLYRDLNQ